MEIINLEHAVRAHKHLQTVREKRKQWLLVRENDEINSTVIYYYDPDIKNEEEGDDYNRLTFAKSPEKEYDRSNELDRMVLKGNDKSHGIRMEYYTAMINHFREIEEQLIKYIETL